MALGPFNERWTGLREISRWELVAGLMLLAPIVAMGVWPDPFVDRIAVSVLELPNVEAVSGAIGDLPVVRAN